MYLYMYNVSFNEPIGFLPVPNAYFMTLRCFRKEMSFMMHFISDLQRNILNNYLSVFTLFVTFEKH